MRPLAYGAGASSDTFGRVRECCHRILGSGPHLPGAAWVTEGLAILDLRAWEVGIAEIRSPLVTCGCERLGERRVARAFIVGMTKGSRESRTVGDLVQV